MEPFKNLLGVAAATQIAVGLEKSFGSNTFSSKKFLIGLEAELAPLELKQRMVALCGRIGQQVDRSPKSFPGLVGALEDLSGFLVWPLTTFVAEHGLSDFDRSMKALKEMTKVFTAEFAVRPFFLIDEPYMLKLFADWALDPNEHVRRLVSEGSRPLLPWGQKLPRFLENPSLTWPLLKKLEGDSSKYVQTSVANHMNDISKAHGDWLVKQLKGWGNDWVVKKATRTLVKKGHAGALKLQGVDPQNVQCVSATLRTKTLKVGQALLGIATLKNTGRKTVKVIADVEVHLLKANGKHTVKVFKGVQRTLKAGERQSLELKTPLRKVTTRVYHPGVHYWNLIVNGQRGKKQRFVLKS